MRGKWSMQTAVAALCLLSVLVVLVSAECPNGCSGNGDCQSKDMCNCYMNYQGNDCADRTCLFGHAFVDTPKGDINMDKDRLTPGWLLKDSQQHPAMTYEHFNPDAIADEAHFYMECSNKGICDRSTGLCQCFDGYEGNGCRRMTCPGKCSGHGTCESIRELGLKAGGTLFGNEGSAGPVKYDLWDANSTYGCRCDPWYHGPDCAKRSCKVGVDPLFLSAGTPTYETFVVHAGDAALAAGAWIRLRLFDYYGESYITTKIPVLDSAVDAATLAANIKAVADAIKAVPNLTFRTVSCGQPGLTASSWAGFPSTRPASLGLSVVCQFSGNPGKIRLPEIADSNGVTVKVVTTATQQGSDDEWFNVKPDNIVASSIDVATRIVTVTSTTALVASVAAPKLVKIGADIVLVNAASATALTLEFPMMHTLATSTQVFTSELIASVTAGPAIGAVLAVGDDTIKYVVDPTAAHPVGSILFFHNQFFTVQANYLFAANDWRVKLSKPFGGDSGTGAAIAVAATALAYRVVLTADAHLKGYKYVSECSGRGMCGYDTGVCTCFKGYTNDNCDTQNILAL